jgi:hypothetical protein
VRRFGVICAAKGCARLAGGECAPLCAAQAAIVKGSHQVQYGHKLNLVTGKSGLILDLVVEAGNPADVERFLPMLDRHIARRGAAAPDCRRRQLCQPRQSHRRPRPAASPMSPWTRTS